MKSITTILLIFISLFLLSCNNNSVETDPIETYERGEIVEIISEKEVSLEELENLISTFAGSNDFDIELKNDIKYYSVLYRTIDHTGNPTDASGLFVIPSSGNFFPLISLHHGTQSKKNNVGSINPLSSFDALLSGALGYVAVSADMLGLGYSNLVHPYHIADVNANTVIDFIRAVKKFANEKSIALNGDLFLGGYSQGGYTTMAVHKKMQTELFNEFNVTASAPMAGAHDLMGTAQYIVSNDNYDKPSFLAFLTYAYSTVYGWNNLSEFFQAPYHLTIPDLFNGSLTTDEIDDHLPGKLSELFTPSLLDAIKNGTESLMTTALINNSLLNWGPQAPVLIVHGNADTFVPYQNAITAKENWEANGATNVQLITIDGGNHYSSVLPAIMHAINFFENYRSDLRIAINY